jgi:hypothetical protein
MLPVSGGSVTAEFPRFSRQNKGLTYTLYGTENNNLRCYSIGVIAVLVGFL